MNIRMIAAAVAASSLLLTACAEDVADVAGDVASEVDEMASDAMSEVDEMTDTDASVKFAGIADGDTVASPVTVSFEATGFEIVAAGSAGDSATAGHMHVMVDTDCVATGELIVADDNHIHFGDGSTSADLDLAAGEHTLCLQAGDDEHNALDVTDVITITVE